MIGTSDISAKTVARAAWSAGYRGVAGLARATKRSRKTIYSALRNPRRYGPTIAAIHAALNRRDS